MTVAVEFVGGPLDGQVREMPDCRDEWHFPQAPRMGWVTAGCEELLPNEPPLVYRRRGPAVPSGPILYDVERSR